MKTNSIKLLVVALLSTFIFHPSSLLGQGALTPPGAPAPTMKTLDQVYARLDPRTAITNIANGYTISVPGSYYLTTNLTGTSGYYGITISSGNVTLDLNGFLLQGVPGSIDGVYVNGSFTNITVRNGSISGWGSSGIDAYSASVPRNLVFERLTFSTNHSAGIETEAGSEVRDCCSIGNTTGIFCYGGLVSGCVTRNNGTGISAYNCTVRDCQVWSNGRGIYANSSTVSDCYVGYNQQSGIYVYTDGCQITGNNCYHNNISANTSEAGIYIDNNYSRVEDNHVTGSGYAGIAVSNSGYINNIIIKNTVIGNGANNYIIPAGQIYGPLITTTGIITNSNPWANFSF